MRKPQSPVIDRIAVAVAAACGLHCICFPILVAITTASNFIRLLSRPVEIAFIASAMILGLANLSLSWWKSHHRPECLAMFAIGMTMILTHDNLSGIVLSSCVSVVGGALVGAAHFRNIQLMRKCACCEPDAGAAPQKRKGRCRRQRE
ncbi:MAG TPA: MerC domain-containing protein [Bryobacteraceae bacterium]|jgi:hypothetical protein|nr:MerC domain-containing protein [Bryobacteraceae bacterium]